MSVSQTDSSRIQATGKDSLAAEYTFYVVVTNRDLFLKECLDSFRKCYPSVKPVLVDNSGAGQFKALGESLGFEVHATDRIRSVSENQNWILDHCPTKYFVFTADDIVFLKPGFLEEAAEIHQKGLELVSFGVDDPCAFSMETSAEPRIGRFNTAMAGKEGTDMDIKRRCDAVYGFLPSVGGFWRKTPLWWESKYITHRHDKPDVNQFLISRGIQSDLVHNESASRRYMRVCKMLYTRFAVVAGATIFNSQSLIFRRGLHPDVFEIRSKFHSMSWPNNRILSIGQVPLHHFWPYYLGRFLGAPAIVHKTIIEKCEAYKPFLDRKFTAEKHFRVIADDVLNVENYYQPRSVDLAVWFDGPEHLQKERASEALQKLERVTSGLLLIGTPLGFHPQGTDGTVKNIQNPYNAHLSGWEPAEFEKLGYHTHISNAPIPAFVAWKYVSTNRK